MKREREAELLARLADPAAERPGPLGARSMRNPASAYVDRERFAREREALFARLPNLLGSRASAPGRAPFSPATWAESRSSRSASPTEPCAPS